MSIPYNCDVVKQCKKCGEAKPPASFSAGRSQCKPCRSLLSGKWYRDNPSKIDWASRRARSAAWQKENRLLVAAQARERYRSDPSKNIAATRKWQKTNSDRQAAREAARRAKIAGSTPAWANRDAIRAIYVAAKREGKQVDHIVPLRSKLVCGLHCESNLQLLSKSENVRKNNRRWPDMP